MRKKLLVGGILILSTLFLANNYAKYETEKKVSSQLQAISDTYPAIDHITFGSVQADLFSYIEDNTRLTDLTVYFNIPELQDHPLHLKQLHIHDTLFQEGKLNAASIDFQALHIKNAFQLIKQSTPHANEALQLPIDHDALSVDGRIEFDTQKHHLAFNWILRNNHKKIVHYKSVLKGFTLPQSYQSVEEITQPLKQLSIQQAELHLDLPFNLLDPMIADHRPEVTLMANELGYTSLNAQLVLDTDYQASTHEHHVQININVKNASSLDLDLRFRKNISALQTTLTHALLQNQTTPQDWKELSHVNIEYLKARVKDKGLAERLYSIAKAYFNLDPPDLKALVAHYAEEQPVDALRLAFEDVLAFIDMPASFSLILAPDQAFNPYQISDELLSRNKVNYRQFELENSVARNEQEKAAIARHYQHKQNMVIQDTLHRVGFKTEYHP